MTRGLPAMPQPFVQVDAFTSEPFSGNPAAVCSASCGARCWSDEPLVFASRVEIKKRAGVINLDISDGRGVRADDDLGSRGWIRTANLVEQRTVDQDWMAVLMAANGADDRCASPQVAIDDRPDGAGVDERDVDQRDEGRRHARSIDGVETDQQRRQLAGLVIRIRDEPRRHTGARKHAGDHVCIMTEDHDHVAGGGDGERAHDSRQKGIAAFERQVGLGPSHARRLAGSEDDRGNHPTMIVNLCKNRGYDRR
jgi:hypothetical protein